MGYIYKIVNDVNDKIYIGQTRNEIKYRWQHHLWKGHHPEKLDTDYPLYRSMRKYGFEHFHIEVIEKIENDNLNEREKYWIQYFDCVTPKGYNCSFGGDGVEKFNSNEILAFFNSTGKKNASETARQFGCSIQTVLKILEANDLSGQGQYQPVYQIDRNTGEIIEEFSSLKEAQEAVHIGRTQLWSAVNGEAKTAGGYIWCKIQDYDNFNIDNYIDNKNLAIRCIEENKTFPTISAAVKWLKETGRAAKAYNANISKVCDIPNRTAYKFHWSSI